MPAHRLLRRAVALILLALAVAACAKKSDPSAPSGEPNTYPRSYPSE